MSINPLEKLDISLNIVNLDNIIFPENFKGIKSYEEYSEIATHRNTKSSEFLEKLQKVLAYEGYKNNVDPVKYLYYLHYIEKKETRDIFNFYKHFEIYSSEYSIKNILTNIFGWEKLIDKESKFSENKKITKESIIIILEENGNNPLNKEGKEKINNKTDMLEKTKLLFVEKGYCKEEDFKEYLKENCELYTVKKVALAISHLAKLERLNYKLSEVNLKNFINKK